MESCGEHHWAGCLRNHAATLRIGDLSGITGFLGSFGGMGSLNDIGLRHDDPINHEIGEAFSLATALAHHYDLTKKRNA